MDALCCGYYLMWLLEIRQWSLVLLRDTERFVAKLQLSAHLLRCLSVFDRKLDD